MKFFAVIELLSILLFAMNLAAEVKPADCFGENMVLQRELPVRIWGTAAPNEKVRVRFAGRETAVDADKNGNWMATLEPLAANKVPGTLEISGRDNTVILKNILVGEVWLCTGQSNMYQPMWGTRNNYRQKDGDKIAASANYSLIRIATVPLKCSINPETSVNMSWSEVRPEVLKPFSAVGFFFGLELMKSLDVPVGLVHTSWGGTRIEPWTTREGFLSVPEGEKLAGVIGARTPGTREFEKNARKMIDDQRVWVERADSDVRSGRVPSPPPSVPEMFSRVDRSQPGMLYNAMIHPLTPMTVRGAIWYQGEANRGNWYDYRWMMHALLNGWKKAFQNPDFQFHFVQIAPYRYSSNRPRQSFGLLEAQRKFADESGCGMAVINDVGNINDIHPADKRPVGKRLALLALNRTYGKKNVEADAPRLDSYKIAGDKFILDFKHVKQWSTPGAEPVAGFEVAGIDGGLYSAFVDIDGTRLIVSAPRVKSPRYLRYLGANISEGNLRNENGLVPAPFSINDPRMDEELKYLENRAGLLYEYDLLAGCGGNGRMKPLKDNSNKFPNVTLKRINYLIVAKTRKGEIRFLDLGVDPFTANLDLLGVPGSKTLKNLAAPVSNLSLRTNIPNLLNEEIATGNIEFFFTSYGPRNSAGVRGASDTVFDSGDSPSNNIPGYGCMQFHGAGGYPIFCFNSIRRGKLADLGFGENPDGQPDWTFSKSGGQYESAKLYVFITVQ